MNVIMSTETYVYTLRAFGKEGIAKFLMCCFRVVELAGAHVRFDSCHALVQQLGRQQVGYDDATIAGNDIENVVQRL